MIHMANVLSGKFSCPSVSVYKLYTTRIRTFVYEGSVYFGHSLRVQSVSPEKSQQQSLEAAGHIALTVRK